MSKGAGLIGNVQAQDVPPRWRRTTLGEIGEYINGRGFKKSEWSDTGLPIIRIQNLTGTGKEQNHYDGEIDERHVVNPGDLLISWSATLGAFLWTGPRAALNQHIFKVRSRVDKKFHYYLMQHILSDLYRQTHGAGMVHITKSKFDSMPVVVPETEDDQKLIVAEIEKQFSRLDEAVANLKRVKANLKRYKAAVLKAAVEGRLVETEAELARHEGRNYETGTQLLQRILETRHSEWQGKGKYKESRAPDTTHLPELPEGWVWTNCDAVLLRIEAGASFKCIERPPVGDETGVLKVSAVTWGEFDELESKTCVDPDRIEESYLVQGGDFLFSRANTIDLVGACVIAKGVSKRLMLSDKTLRFRISPLVNVYWLLTCLRSKWGRLEIERLATGNQESMRNIGQDRIRQIRIPLPPLVEQSRIISEIDRCFTSSTEVEKQVKQNSIRANRLGMAILSKAFHKHDIPSPL